MALTKEQKFNMIRDVELRLAKEELAERHIKNMEAIENSDTPLRTLREIVDKNVPPVQEVAIAKKESVVAGQALRARQRDEWHSLNEQHFEELKSLSPNSDLKAFAAQKQAELENLLARHGRDIDRVEKSDTPLEDERAILYSYKHLPNQEIMAQQLKQETFSLTDEDKELFEQSEEAVNTPFRKDGLDSLTEWEFYGLEILAMHDAAKNNINVQEQFENARSMSTAHNTDMER